VGAGWPRWCEENRPARLELGSHGAGETVMASGRPLPHVRGAVSRAVRVDNWCTSSALSRS